jgi:hypothetical protein
MPRLPPPPPAVLASANPVGSRYNPQLSVVENIQLPPSLMSRFDLIYLVRACCVRGWVGGWGRRLPGLGGCLDSASAQTASPHAASQMCLLTLPTLLQLLDKANEASDRKLARHLISLYGNGVGRLGNEVRLGRVGAALRVCCHLRFTAAALWAVPKKCQALGSTPTGCLSRPLPTTPAPGRLPWPPACRPT